MPTSYYQAVPVILEEALAFRPASVLDLGVGFGKYGLLLRERLDVEGRRYHRPDWQARIDGVEGWAPYRNPIHDYIYSQMFYGRIEDVLPQLGNYDVVLMVDVLEHFERPVGLKVLREALDHAGRALIVSTPVWPAPLTPYLGNALDTHRSRWTPAEFAAFDHRHRLVPVGDGGAQVFTFSGQGGG